MDAIEIEQHRLIVEKGKELLKVLFNDGKPEVESIINRSKTQIQWYNNKYLTAIDITNKEKGIFKSSINVSVHHKYKKLVIKKLEDALYTYDNLEYICESHRIYDEDDIIEYGDDYWDYSENELCNNCKKEMLKRHKKNNKFYEAIKLLDIEFEEAIKKTCFEDRLIEKYVLNSRKYSFKNKILYETLKESIKTLALKAFFEQNKQLINKYL